MANTPIRFSALKYWILIFLGSIVLLILLIFLLNISMLDVQGKSLKDFSWSNMLRGILISIPFMAAILVLDYYLVRAINASKWMQRNLWIRILFESTLTFLLACIFVLLGNLPFISSNDINAYIFSLTVNGSLVAAILINAFIIIVIELFAQYRLSQERTLAMNALQLANAQMQYQQLKSQINPHFLFNSLNTLVALVHQDAQKAATYIQQLSQVYRYVLSHDQQDLVSLREELNFTDRYLQILQLRFGTGLQVEVQIRPDDLSRQLPPLSLQLLIENAVKHNTLMPSTPLQLEIASDGIYVWVINNLVSRKQPAPGTGLGLRNLEQKYALLGCELPQVMRTSSQFSVRLPLL